MGLMKKNIYILHGWSYSLNKWRQFIDELKQRGFKPILLQVPGLTRQSHRVWTVSSYVEWLKKEIKNEEKIILVGHSNGGRISLAFSLQYPERVWHLILIDSAGIYHNNMLLQVKRLLFKNLAKVGKRFTSSQRLKNLLYKLARTEDYKNATPQMQQTLIHLLESDRDLTIGQITLPTTLIWGKNDKVTPLSDGRLMNNLIKNSKFFIIDGARHSPQFTNPQEVAQIIVDSLKA